MNPFVTAGVEAAGCIALSVAGVLLMPTTSIGGTLLIVAGIMRLTVFYRVVAVALDEGPVD